MAGKFDKTLEAIIFGCTRNIPVMLQQYWSIPATNVAAMLLVHSVLYGLRLVEA